MLGVCKKNLRQFAIVYLQTPQGELYPQESVQMSRLNNRKGTLGFLKELPRFSELDEKEIETICDSVERQFEKREKQNYHPDDELSTYLKTVDEIETKELEWIVENLIPKNQVTIFAGDGGVGKTLIWVHIAAKLSTGEPLFFEKETNRKSMKIIYFFGER